MRVHYQLLTFIAIITVVLVSSATLAATGPQSVGLSRLVVRGASLWVITADLNDPGLMVDIGLPEKGIAHSEAFSTLVGRRAPIAAVTGTYFDTRTLIPTGSIVIGSKRVHESRIGAGICFTSDNRVRFVDAKVGEACDLSDAESGLRTGPRLLAGGEYALNPSREGFHHPGLFGARTRMALGLTAHNKLLLVYVSTPVTFGRLASIMKTVGAVDALCLDGGTSSAMYYEGRMIHRPGRSLTNVLEVRYRPQPAIAEPIAAVSVSSTPFVIRVFKQARSVSKAELHESSSKQEPQSLGTEQLAILADPMKLRFAKGLHTFFPVNRA